MSRSLRLLTGAAAVVGAALVASAVAPAVLPAIGESTLTALARSTGDIPIPSTAQRCPDQVTAAPGAVRWCLPANTSPNALRRWYDAQLPSGRSTGGLRWCMTQLDASGATKSLWSTERGLVGYELPSTRRRPPERPVAKNRGRLVLEVVRLPARRCPAVARVTRTAPG